MRILVESNFTSAELIEEIEWTTEHFMKLYVKLKGSNLKDGKALDIRVTVNYD